MEVVLSDMYTPQQELFGVVKIVHDGNVTANYWRVRLIFFS